MHSLEPRRLPLTQKLPPPCSTRGLKSPELPSHCVKRTEDLKAGDRGAGGPEDAPESCARRA